LPSVVSHAIAALGLGACFYRPEVPRRVWALGALCAALPDADVIGFRFGIAYGDLWGHRGLSHSIPLAALVATAIVSLSWRREIPGMSCRALWTFFFLATASHGLLDALTDGGLGVALLAPFDTTRYFFPARPIKVSPIGLRRFLSERGVAVLWSEVRWVWLPSALIAGLALAVRRRSSRRAGAMSSAWISVVILLPVLHLPAVAQDSSASPIRRSTLVTAAEITAAVTQADTGAVADAVLRVLPIAGEYNVGVSVVRRSQVHGRTPPDAIVHEAITEVYHIIEGRGILITGGTVEAAVPLPADDPLVRTVIGPSTVGRAIRGGTRQQVGPGDLVIIPPHTAHGFTQLQTARVVYVLVRIDPHRVLAPH
jgi:inner membrane protein